MRREPKEGETWAFAGIPFEFVGYGVNYIEVNLKTYYIFRDSVDGKFFVMTEEQFFSYENRRPVPPPDPVKLCICGHEEKSHGWRDNSCVFSYNCSCRSYKEWEQSYE